MSMQRIRILPGMLILLVGLFYPYLGKLPLGRLPGDIVISRPNFKIYFPVTTTLLLSVILSLILWIVRK